MRIISGKWRGRKLANIEDKLTNVQLRPTLNRVRESIFNIISHGEYNGVDGAKVLDLFSGSGAMGFESLSRGAEKVCFVENESRAVSIIKKNVKLLSADPDVTVLCKDATKLNKNLIGEFDLVFLDPPYGLHLGEVSLKSAIKGGWIAQGAIIVWEEKGYIPTIDNLHLLTERFFGKIKIQFFTLREKSNTM